MSFCPALCVITLPNACILVNTGLGFFGAKNVFIILFQWYINLSGGVVHWLCLDNPVKYISQCH